MQRCAGHYKMAGCAAHDSSLILLTFQTRLKLIRIIHPYKVIQRSYVSYSHSPPITARMATLSIPSSISSSVRRRVSLSSTQATCGSLLSTFTEYGNGSLADIHRVNRLLGDGDLAPQQVIDWIEAINSNRAPEVVKRNADTYKMQLTSLSRRARNTISARQARQRAADYRQRLVDQLREAQVRIVELQAKNEALEKQVTGFVQASLANSPASVAGSPPSESQPFLDAPPIPHQSLHMDDLCIAWPDFTHREPIFDEFPCEQSKLIFC